MPTVQRRASVSSRAEDVFEYVADWRNLSNYIPMFADLEATTLVQYGQGTSVDLTMLLGNKAQMRTTLDYTDFVKGRRLVFKTMKGVRTKTSWDFKDIGGKCLVTLDFEFELPATISLRDDERLALARDLEDAWGKSLGMLKWAVESKPKDKG